MQYNGVSVPDDYFEPAMQKLTDRFLKANVDAVPITPTPANERLEVQRMIEKAKHKF